MLHLDVNFPYMFDSWADPVAAHILPLKSSMTLSMKIKVSFASAFFKLI